MGPPRRRAEDRAIDELRQEVHDLTSRLTWPKKNGDTWQAFVGKFFTMDRILLMALLLYTFGGDVRDFQGRITGVEERGTTLQGQQATIQKQHEKVIRELTVISDGIERHEAVIADMQERQTALEQRTDERLRLIPTRKEFNELRALLQGFVSRTDKALR